MSKKEWSKYKVGEKSTRKNWTEQSCQPFSTVRHITHIKDAIRIIEDGKIRSSLVWDESKLNNSRTCVSWVSPNTWANGSIYGNISFEYIWDDLIEGKNFYWVEDFKEYNPPAYRLLITEKDYSDSKLVISYPVEDRDGPIYFDGNKWYRNGYYTGEFLIDQDLDIDLCYEIDFVNHHKQFCSKSDNLCSDIKLSNQVAGSKFLANIIGRELTQLHDLFWDKSTKDKKLTFQAQSAINSIFLLFQKRCSQKSTKLSQKKKHYLIKACLCAFSEGNKDFLDNIVSMIGNEEEIENTLQQVVEHFFCCEFSNIMNW
ncbi:MAG: hypothetical protein ABIJ52_02350 [Pseudomonadota bacterium]